MTHSYKNLAQTLFKSADKLRKNIDAAEYKHIVLGLVFLKYISDSFLSTFELIKSEGGDTEDKDEYLAYNAFFVPTKARWSYIMDNAKQSNIGTILDSAMQAIEQENASLKGVLPKVYAKENLDSIALGGLIDLLSNLSLQGEQSQSSDILGHIFEYFLGEFALSEGKKGGQFYTPKSVVELLVAMLEPYKGRVFDPCCGSGGMFVQSELFVQIHQGSIDDISIYGQESNQTTWRLAKMNLAIRQIDSSQVKWNSEGSFLNDVHKDLKADFVIANPPFNDSDYSGELLRNDGRWKFGTPPITNANYAWIQHFIYHLSPKGVAGFVLAKGSLTSNTANEGAIRKALIESNLIDCIVNLPAKLFLNTQIPACLWFVRRSKTNKEILFIDARNCGELINPKNRILTQEDIQKISHTYHAWRKAQNPQGVDSQNLVCHSKQSEESQHIKFKQNSNSTYADIKGFCKSASLEEVAALGYTLTPGRFVGLEEEEQGFDFETEFTRLKDELKSQMQEEKALNQRILANLALIEK
ncbi:class I SAM-dependent DNA methyltransferase [Campylobacter sp. MIT 21-1685]|uniref:type I restriction-modification system subunit M n=1 Tax=unclassified Campylobacter TaxID=2593542 RepID=UPI00224AB505|nr:MULTISPECIES: class I SAM-dependent DNA methyltransferase [unclassified Campylobacter]MCX2683755.1 class I SAM-dependent DNA methyltransferase [Campylobacter sp. MIT 21-1684]MCX2752039.1 class I SAM-dependent DNA methyltransferase [Campylobacter sp. MIT 21-1682]MCX2808235.1 class I SAM-dependent DNA methyltransferase [Campylobacter sp. MIT 21-1685]